MQRINRDLEFVTQELRRLHTQLDCLEQLFFSTERTALKKHASNLLAELDRALVTDILLTVSRLCDPIESGKLKPNLVFERFICKHPKLETKIGDTLDELKAHYKKRIQPVRNRRLGHNDLSLSRGRRQLGWPTVKAVKKARDLCTEIVYVLYAELKHAAISFVPSSVPGEIDWIEASLRYVNADRLKLKPYLEEVRLIENTPAMDKAQRTPRTNKKARP